MAIYVDPLLPWPPGNKLWCHLATDGPIEELHSFAQGIGLKRSWFQGHDTKHPHYDLRPTMRRAAVIRGAIEVSTTELYRLCFTWRSR